MKHIKEHKYIQNDSGGHDVLILIADTWFDGKDLFDTMDLVEKGIPVWMGAGLGNPVLKYLVEQEILFKQKGTPIMVGLNRSAFNQFKVELKNKLLPILISE